MRPTRGNDDGIERGFLRPAARAIGATHTNVVVAEPRQPPLGFLGKLLVSFNSEHLLGNAGQNRSRVAGAS